MSTIDTHVYQWYNRMNQSDFMRW